MNALLRLLPRLLLPLLLPFLVLAGLGFAISLIVHLLAVGDVLPPGGKAVMAMHGGVFVVMLPAVLVMTRLNQGQRTRIGWKQILSGCPNWMRYGAYVVFAYTILNFLLMVGKQPTDDVMSPAVLRLFSGHWMCFYGAAFCTLYSVYRQPWMLDAAQCPNGHEVVHTDSFCPTCGKSIPPRRSATVSS